MLTLALAKGRILEEALPLLARAGYTPSEDAASTRKLILGTGDPGLRLILVRAADVVVLRETPPDAQWPVRRGSGGQP